MSYSIARCETSDKIKATSLCCCSDVEVEIVLVLPLIPVVAALNAGGTLVAHAAGGLIVSSTVSGGYVAGTYISTASLAAFLTGSAVGLGALGTAAISGTAIWAYGTMAGAMTSVIGSAGIFGTAIGATGITGFLMSVGVLDTVPVLVPVTIGLGLAALGALLGYSAYRAVSVQRLRRKTVAAEEGVELQFSAKDAKLVENIIRNLAKRHSWLWRVWMQFAGRKREQV